MVKKRLIFGEVWFHPFWEDGVFLACIITLQQFVNIRRRHWRQINFNFEPYVYTPMWVSDSVYK